MSTFIQALIEMHQRNAGLLPEIPCAQAHNTWNRDHHAHAHDWFSKQTYPGMDARCPGSVLPSSAPAADKVTCEHYPDGQPAGGCYWCGTYPN